MYFSSLVLSTFLFRKFDHVMVVHEKKQIQDLQLKQMFITSTASYNHLLAWNN